MRQRARRLALSSLVCVGRRTVTGLVSAGGRQFEDWSADYRVFSKRRFDVQKAFEAARAEVLDHLPEGAPLVVAMDDTILRKTGPKAHGVAYRRDPLGPLFQVNLVRAQRFVQLSAAVPEGVGAGPARMVPIDLRHAPTPKKPGKKAAPEKWDEYRRAQSKMRLGLVGANMIKELRENMDRDLDARDRPLWMVVDGSFTNREVLKNLPGRVTLIGRIRKDAKLCHAPERQAATGRRRMYGQDAPTPEQLRRDDSIPWQKAKVFAAGKLHQFKFKVMRNLRWRAAGGDKKLMMIAIAPLAYRPRKGAKLLYRKPAYLICTDDGLAVEDVLQAYVWRWDIEVNFRDEKTILGVGQAQVRNPNSVETEPALMVLAYALLLLAAIKTYGAKQAPELLPQPKWRNKEPKRQSTNTLINLLRQELWAKPIGNSFTHFAPEPLPNTKYQKQNPQLKSTLFYAVS